MKGFGTTGTTHTGSAARALFRMFIVSKMTFLLIPTHGKDFRNNLLHVSERKLFRTKLSVKLNDSEDFLEFFVVKNFLSLFNAKSEGRDSNVYGTHK
jgi:hypothetical protein